MTEASVGFQCPDCVRSGRGPTVRNRVGAPVNTGRGPSPVGFDVWSATTLIVATRVLIGLIDVPTRGRGLVQSWLMMSNAHVAGGQLWRLVTSSFTSFGLFSLVINSMFLLFVGRAVESELGRWRMFATYLLCTFGGSALFFIAGGPTAVTGGDTAALVGVIGLYAMSKWRRGEDVRGDLILLGLLIAMGLFGGGAYWLSLIGGALTGAVTGLGLEALARRRRASWQWALFVGVAVAWAVLMAGRLFAG